MSKKLLKYCFFNNLISYLLIFLSSTLFMSCAPRVAPPPLYKDLDLSLNEVIKIARRDINVLKAIVSINIEKGNKHYSYVNASMLLKKPRWLHIRLYRFGIMVGNFFIKDDVVYTISGKGSDKFKDFGRELYYSVFWWEDLENAMMYKQNKQYVIKAENKEIRLNSSTLQPESQEITTKDKKIYILYDKPKQQVDPTPRSAQPVYRTGRLDSEERFRADFWFPSVVKITIDAYRFTLKVDKLIVNPPLGENDFKIPEEE